MAVVASVNITVQKTTEDIDAQYEVSAEVYAKKEDGTYESQSQFEPGETAYIGLFKLHNVVTVSESVASAGTLSSAGTANFENREDLVFTTLASTKSKDAKYNEASISKPATSYNLHWYTSAINLVLLDDKKTFRSQQFNIAVASCLYNSEAQMYELQIPAQFPSNPHLKPDEQSYPIAVIFVCKTPLDE